MACARSLMERPVFRIGLAGLDPRDARLIEIVFRHGAHNRHEFQLLDVLDLTRLDIVIANPVESEGLDALTAVAAYPRRIPTVSAVPRGSQIAARHSVTIDRLTLQLLPILNRVVLEEGLLERVRPTAELGDVLTGIHRDDEAEAGGAATAVAPAVALQAAAAPGPRAVVDNDAFAVVAEAIAAATPGLGRRVPAGPGPAGNPLAVAFNSGISDMVAEMVAAVAAPASPPPNLPPKAESARPAAEPSRAAGGPVPIRPPSPEPGLADAAGDPLADGIDACADRVEAEVIAVLGSLPGGHTVARGRVARIDRSPGSQADWLAELGGDSAWAPLPAFHPRPVEQRGPALQVLVADPSVAARTRLAAELNLLGMDVFCVASGGGVARAVAERHFDLVIIEATLTDTDGLTLLHWLRSKSVWRRTPVMLLQARPGWIDAARARLDGHLTLVPKPVTRRNLASRLRRVLRHVWVVDEFSPYIE